MSDVVISAENLGKKYIIGHQSDRERYTALRDVVGRTIKGLARSARDMIRGRPIVAGDDLEEFWALKDINFEIKQGEVVGIIGRNGAGKSTLLKILSRITEPSEGRVTIKGRVASLLEVGTGFHPELTGRENIYLNGAILGMTRAEIRRKFDEIVAFAGVEKFLDTPVKRYSSGMYVRLAFAVAAHLEPEILVVDEVLAVGDAEFQKKCLGKMGEVAKGGRTVLFVSHNMSAVTQLCERCIWLDSGKIRKDGLAKRIVSQYLESGIVVASLGDNKNEYLVEGDGFVVKRITVCSEDGVERKVVDKKDGFLINLECNEKEYVDGRRICIRIIRGDGLTLFQSCYTPDVRLLDASDGMGYSAVIRVPGNILKSGVYYIGVSADVPMQRVLLNSDNIVSFRITEEDGQIYMDKDKWPGVIDPLVEWEVMESGGGM